MHRYAINIKLSYERESALELYPQYSEEELKWWDNFVQQATNPKSKIWKQNFSEEKNALFYDSTKKKSFKEKYNALEQLSTKETEICRVLMSSPDIREMSNYYHIKLDKFFIPINIKTPFLKRRMWIIKIPVRYALISSKDKTVKSYFDTSIESVIYKKASLFKKMSILSKAENDQVNIYVSKFGVHYRTSFYTIDRSDYGLSM